MSDLVEQASRNSIQTFLDLMPLPVTYADCFTKLPLGKAKSLYDAGEYVTQYDD